MDNCNKPHKAKGLCGTHYMRLLKHGDPTKTLIQIHGLECTPEYRVWQNMKARCLNPNKKEYKDYGGRGIKICERWLNSFTNFYEDMGERPANLTLDRINNDGNYEPSNCRWATRKQQVQNTRVYHNARRSK